MEAIVFLVIVVLAGGFIYKYRDTVLNWLNNTHIPPGDPKLVELKDKEKVAHQAVTEYKEKLKLEDEIADRQNRLQEINNQDKE